MQETLFNQITPITWEKCEKTFESTHRKTLEAFGVELDDDPANDPFVVALYVFSDRFDRIGSEDDYINCLRHPCIKKIHRNYTQPDGVTYAVTFELINGYHVSFGIFNPIISEFEDDYENIFVHGGRKSINDSPLMQQLYRNHFNFDSFLTFIGSLPCDAYTYGKYQVTGESLGKIDYKTAFEREKTTSKEKIDALMAAQRNYLREYFS